MKINDTAEANYAAIDIGSNAARLLIKSVEGGRFKRQLILRVPLRLGFDVFNGGELTLKKIDKLRRLMKVFRQLMKIYEVRDYRACATAAMRDASNGNQVIAEIEAATKIKIEIIDGQEEARIIYNNHIDYLNQQKGNYMFVDVGGGSTEVNLLCEGKLLFAKSYDVGTIRMVSGKLDPQAYAAFENELRELTAGLGTVNIIGSGGNINKLYRMSGDSEDQILTVGSLERLYEELKPLLPSELRKNYDLKKDRADVIVPATEVFISVARSIGAEYIYVPSLGLSDGIIDDLYAKNQAAREALA